MHLERDAFFVLKLQQDVESPGETRYVILFAEKKMIHFEQRKEQTEWQANRGLTNQNR